MRQEKTKALFTLSMPSVGSWNGKWTGENNYYAWSCTAISRGKLKYPNLREGGFFYNFGDGWCARVRVTFVTPSECTKAMRKSNGFCGYEWMCDEILKYGRILNMEERDAFDAGRLTDIVNAKA